MKQRFAHRKLLKSVFEISTCGRIQEAPGHREKIDYDVVTTKASDSSLGNSGAKMVLQSCPSLRLGGRAFTTLHLLVSGYRMLSSRSDFG